MNWAATIWMVLMLGFLIVEGACPFHLVSIWFAAGSLVAGIAALLHAALWLQITLFFVVSISLLIAMFPLVKKVMNPKITKTNVDSVVGAQGYVTETIDNIAAVGQVKLNGMYWTARSANGQQIPAGTLVQVERIEGVKAFVTAVNTPVKEEPIVEEVVL
jgi:membrane protein implicated in regulation of membrane protease activity